MKTVLKEPFVAYKANMWGTNTELDPNVFITKKDLDSIDVYMPTYASVIQLYKHSKFKISSLRGKMSKQGINEMRKQYKKIRKEWERGF